MMSRKSFKFALLVLLPLAAFGCARAARDTTGFALNDTATVNASFDETWQAVKAVLRDRELDVYTRDKRGLFVAYSEMKRRFFVPGRIRYTIELSEISDSETGINIETLKEVYGVTLLTYPDWHARKTSDNAESMAILQAIQAKVAAPEEAEAVPAPEISEN